MTLLNIVVVIAVGWALMEFWPSFSTLPYLG